MAIFSAPPASQRVRGLRARIVHRSGPEFPFLHDTMIAPLGGRLLMAWYNCSENEIVGRTIIRGRWSADSAGPGPPQRSSARTPAPTATWSR